MKLGLNYYVFRHSIYVRDLETKRWAELAPTCTLEALYWQMGRDVTGPELITPLGPPEVEFEIEQVHDIRSEWAGCFKVTVGGLYCCYYGKDQYVVDLYRILKDLKSACEYARLPWWKKLIKRLGVK